MLQSKPRLVVCSTVLVIASVLGIAAAGNPSSSIFVNKIMAYLAVPAEDSTSGNKIADVGISHSVPSQLVTRMPSLWQSEAAFTPGDVLVYRVGDGSGLLTTVATPVFLDEYTPAGALVQSVAMPTSASGSQKAMTASGSVVTEGFLTRSVDGRYVVATGYDAPVGTPTSATTSTATNRVIARIDPSANVDTSTALTDAADTSNPRSAVSTNGTDLWIAGGTQGIRYATFGSTTSTLVNTTSLTSVRAAGIFGGQLYISNSGGTSVRLGSVGTGTPSTAGQTVTNLPGLPTTGSPNSYYLADLTGTVPGLDTLYLADDTPGTIRKYSFDGSQWTAKGTFTLSNVRGLTGTTSGTNVTLYVTNGTSLQKVTDTTGYAGTISGAPTSLAAAGGNTAFRGVAFVPVAPPPPVVSTSPTSLSFTVQENGTQSQEKTSTITATNLTANVVCTLTGSQFQISSDGLAWGNAPLTFTNSSGSASGTVHVRSTPNQTGANSGSVICQATGSNQASISLSGAGSSRLNTSSSAGGKVTSDDAGINCGADCTELYVSSLSVNLIATPDPGYSFMGWGGDCSGIGGCQVAMNLNRAVTASFAPTPPTTTRLDFGSDHPWGNAPLGGSVKFTSVLSAQAASAANGDLTWQIPHNITGDADVSTAGTLVSAASVANDAPVTVNGVTFQPLSAGGSSADGTFSFAAGEPNNGYGGYGSPGAPFSGLSAGYQNLLTHGNYGSGESVMTLTLNNLTPGAAYQFQVWVNDSRGASPQPLNAASGGSISKLFGNVNRAGGGTGQYLIGTFTADASTKVITFYGDPGYATLENAFVLRQLSQPVVPVTGKPVSFHDGDCTTATIGSGTTDSRGAATFTTTSLTAGPHTITACFDGDTSYAASSKSLQFNIPVVALADASLADFGSVKVNTFSTSHSTSVTAAGISGPISCSFPNYNFRLSTDDSTWSQGVPLVINPTNGSYSGTLYVQFSPQPGTPGPVSGNIMCQSSDSAPVLLAVSGTDAQPPEFSTAANGTIEGQAFSQNIAYQGYPAPACSRVGGDAFPNGLTLASDCLLSGTPATGTMGTYHVTVNATNGISPDAQHDLRIEVYGTPVFTNANSMTVTTGTSLNFQFTANSNPQNVWNLQSGSLPAGVQFNGGYVGTLTGIPANGTAGNYPIVVQANNGFLTSTQNFTLHVVDPVFEPTVVASGATSITPGAATFNGNVTSDGNGAITERGFYYKQGTGVTNADARVLVSGTTGGFSYTASGLSSGTQYSYRAFAKNSAGETVSAEQTFHTAVVLTYTAGTGGTISGTTPQTLQYGTDATTVTAVPNAHYHFTAWSPGGSSDPVRTDTNVQASGVYVASFALDQFSVIYNGNGSDGGNNPGTQTADYGSQVNLRNNTFTRTGYNFTGWNTTAAGNGTHYAAGTAFTIPANNTTLYAEWTLAPVATMATITSDKNPSNFGDTITLTGTVLAQGTGLPVAQGTAVIYDNGVSGGPGCSGTQLASGTPNAQGKITATTASLGGGIHSITVCYTGASPFQDSNGSVTQTVNKKAQTITFNSISDQSYAPGGNVTFIASADSGLQLDFTSLDTSVCTIPSIHVGQANFVKAGTCKIVASQTGDANYSAATSVEQDFNILKVTPTVTFGTAPSAVYPGPNFTVTASTDNPESSTVTFSYVSGPCSQVSGGTFSPTGVGNCVIRADGAATTDYNAASAQQTVVITAAPPSVQFASAAFTGNESENGVVTVTRSGDLTGTSSLLFSTVSGGTATGGNSCDGSKDYVTITEQSVSFAAGESAKTLNIQLCGDNSSEGNESVNLALTSPSGATLGQNTAVLSINDTASAYRNATPIDLDLGSMGTPSTISVTGAPAKIGGMRVTLYDVSAALPENLEVLLVDPSGTKTYVLMASAGGSTPIDPSAPVTLTLNDNGADVLPDSTVLLTGEYKPTTWTSVSSFPPPAPPNSGGTSYTLPGSSNTRPVSQTMRGRFTDVDPNGVWTLYVRDDAGSPFVSQGVGSIAGGWGLQFLAPTAAAVNVSGRVRGTDGSGLAKARVEMTDAHGNIRTAMTNAFGYYTFEDVKTGEAYVVGVQSRTYTYGTRLLQVFDSVADVDFTPNP